VAGEKPFERFVMEVPQGCTREGTAWIIPRLKELKAKYRPRFIVFPKNGPAAALIDDAVKLWKDDVIQAGSGDEAAAYHLLIGMIKEKTVGHRGKEKAGALWHAMGNAESRDVGDGGKALSRRASETDITPITSATLAVWALNKMRRNYNHE
jgi:hypothetical protein